VESGKRPAALEPTGRYGILNPQGRKIRSIICTAFSGIFPGNCKQLEWEENAKLRINPFATGHKNEASDMSHVRGFELRSSFANPTSRIRALSLHEPLKIQRRHHKGLHYKGWADLAAVVVIPQLGTPRVQQPFVQRVFLLVEFPTASVMSRRPGSTGHSEPPLTFQPRRATQFAKLFPQ